MVFQISPSDYLIGLKWTWLMIIYATSSVEVKLYFIFILYVNDILLASNKLSLDQCPNNDFEIKQMKKKVYDAWAIGV